MDHPRTSWLWVAPLLAAAVFVSSSCKKKEPAVTEVEEEVVEVEEAPELPVAPSAFPAMKIPEDSPQTIPRALVGSMLFFDPRLSVDGSRSCYSCHQNEHGNGGGTPLAVGAKEKQLTRHSPVIWNVAYFDELYWDGRSGSLEAQAKGAWGGGNMGVGKDNLEKKAKELSKIKGYREAFAQAFPDEGMTADTIAKALAAYERTLVCNNTQYDRYAQGYDKALTDQQKEGWALFMGKAQCVVCHTPPMFSSAMGIDGGIYYNAGIGTEGVEESEVDIGRAAVTKDDADWAAFKVPSLRNISKSAPYFHDGSVATLKEAVTLMATGGIDNKNKTPLLADRGLTDSEIDALVAFLGALDCPRTLEKPELP
ncbi:MAG: cytochrome c peroxidase [Myxococcota bacterium]